jgi:hypothetical protein
MIQQNFHAASLYRFKNGPRNPIRDLCQSRAKRGVASGLRPESLNLLKMKSRHSLDATSFTEVSIRVWHELKPFAAGQAD